MGKLDNIDKDYTKASIYGIERGNRSIIIYAICATIFVIISLFGIVHFKNSYHLKESEEQREYLKEIAYKNEQLTDFSINIKWQFTASMINAVTESKPKSVEQLQKVIDRITRRTENTNIKMLVFDDKATYYGANKLVSTFENKDNQKYLLESKDKKLVIFDKFESFDNKMCICFVERLNKEIVLDDGQRITYLAYVQTMEHFEKTYELSSYTDKTNVIITDGEGHVRYRKQNIHYILLQK